MKKLKEKVLKTIILLTVVSSILPFFYHDVYAAEQTQIVPTWNWGSQYANQFTVTNFCEGSGTSVSCELRFTANNSYYGYLSFDGYNGTTKWIDYKNVWIADGYGAYRYSLYQNGVIQINKINIEGGFLKTSMDNLDLQDIIDLLTAIETDTTSIDNQINTELQRLQSIINNQIVQNGYLETLTKLRQYNIPIESFSFNRYLLNTYQTVSYQNIYYFQYPVYQIPANSVISTVWYQTSYDKYVMIIGINGNVLPSNITNYLTFTGSSVNDINIGDVTDIYSYRNGYKIIKFNYASSTNQNISVSSTVNALQIIAIYNEPIIKTNISTDFSLTFGLRNELLDNLQIIAQGTQQSNSSSSELEDNASDFDDVAGNVYNLENSFNTGLNSSLQQIDTSFDVGNTFGSKFLLAADWVRVQFNTITASNPFGTILSFSLLLGVALLIIGKVLG